MRIVLKQKRRLDVLKNLIPLVLDENTDNKIRTKYQFHIDNDE
jgi:hypothetical protein